MKLAPPFSLERSEHDTAAPVAAAAVCHRSRLHRHLVSLFLVAVCASSLTSTPAQAQATGTFKPTGSLATGRHGHTATLLPNGKVLVAGGYVANNANTATAELYDPATSH